MTTSRSWEVAPSVKLLAEEDGWNYTAFDAPVRQWREPSGTVEAVMRELIADPRPFYESHTRVEKGDPKQAIRQLARLYCHSSYPIPEAFVCEVPGPCVNRYGTVATTRRQVLTESHREYWPKTRFDCIRTLSAQPPQLAGRWFSLLTYYPHNYAHWLMDLLPLTLGLDHVEGDFSLLLPEKEEPFHGESLRLLGLDRFPARRLPASFVQVERLILPHSAINSGTPRGEHLAALRDRMWKGADVVPARRRRIFISRAGSTRAILNEADLIPLLNAHGFEIVQAEKLSLTEQVRLFSQAQIVAGAHGAGMMNQLFAPKGTDIIEFFNPVFWHENNARISTLLGQRHWHLFGRNVSASHATVVDPKQCAQLLDFVLERHP
jgi:hypothetical protein